jgi:uncharacterized protein with von Willebrand factor type A (vWA) domain
LFDFSLQTFLLFLLKLFNALITKKASVRVFAFPCAPDSTFTQLELFTTTGAIFEQLFFPSPL